MKTKKEDIELLEEDEELDEEDEDEDEVDEEEETEEETEEVEDEEEDEEIEEQPKAKKSSEPKYTSDHITKIISAKHNKMKSQFTKKLEEQLIPVQGKLEEAEAVVDWVCKNSGMSREAVLSKIGYAASGKKAAVDPKIFENFEATRDKNEVEAEVNQIESKIKKYPGFKENKQLVIDYAMDTGLSVDKAYWALLGPSAIEHAKKQSANDVLYRKQAKMAKKTETASPSAKTQTYTKADKEAADAVGMSVEDYIKYSKIDNYDDFVKTYKKNKKK